MSRFFVSGYSSESAEEDELLNSSEEELVSSSEEKEADEEKSEEEEEEEEEETDSEFDDDDMSEESSEEEGVPRGSNYFLKSNFMKGAQESESESDDEGRKVVKSGKEKVLDELKTSIDSLKSASDKKAWIEVLSEYDKVGKLILRLNKLAYTAPNIYVMALATLEDSVNTTGANEKESKKKMTADQSKAFNTVRQRIKKNIRDYQPYVDLYRSRPDLLDTEDIVDVQSIINDTAAEKSKVDEAGKGEAAVTGATSPVFHTLKQIAESRGKKNIDKNEQIQVLEDLLDDASASKKPFELISIYQMLLSIRFDLAMNQAFMQLDQWRRNEADLNSLLDLLESKLDEYYVSELGTTSDDIDIEPQPNENGVKIIFGSIMSFIERLDDEFIRHLQNTDPHSIDYVERLKDESSVYWLIVRGQLYLEKNKVEDKAHLHETGQLARAIMRRLEHIYYKPEKLISATEGEVCGKLTDNLNSYVVPKNAQPNEIIESLCEFLNEKAENIYSKNALLCKIYYYAINNDYSKARELFLSSNIYSIIHHAESGLQVMFNRVIVQLGFSAFRAGAIEECHQALNEISNSQRAKELLGQGFSTKYPSQASTAEKQKLLPFHMHINLELLECVFMTCSLLLEIPSLAAASHSSRDSKRKVSARSFKGKLDFHDRQYFTGPPESVKDHIIHASRALQKGNWVKAYNLLSSIKIWNLFPDTEHLLSMMRKKLQVEGLRTYIFTYKHVYSKLSIGKLSEFFDIEHSSVVDILNNMILAGDINGSIEESNNYINFSANEYQRTKLQELAIIMNEKVGLLTEKNEKTASNGFSRKQQSVPQKETIQEENKFRFANVNTNNDEFQTIA